MDEATKDRLFQLLSERVMSLERTIRLQDAQIKSLELAVRAHTEIFTAFAASGDTSDPKN
jgi:hypothetical protein